MLCLSGAGAENAGGVQGDEQGNSAHEVQMDNLEDNVQDGMNADGVQDFGDEFDTDMQQADQDGEGEEGEDEPYHVTEQGDLDEDIAEGDNAEDF